MILYVMEWMHVTDFFFLKKPKNEKTKQNKKAKRETRKVKQKSTDCWRGELPSISLSLSAIGESRRSGASRTPGTPCSAAAHFPEKRFIKRYSLGARGDWRWIYYHIRRYSSKWSVQVLV